MTDLHIVVAALVAVLFFAGYFVICDRVR